MNAAHRDTLCDVAQSLFELPFSDLLDHAHGIHRRHHDTGRVQLSTLLSVKTGGCAEDCGYCAQSAHHDTGLKATPLMEVEAVVEAAKAAKAGGSHRFCMGAAWRGLKDRDLPKVAAMIKAVKGLGLETCFTLGLLTAEQAKALKDAGLDYYNHNLDTSRAHYDSIVSTRDYDDRLETLRTVRKAGLKVCSGGIVGMGESRADRAALLTELAALEPQPDSVPINMLVPMPGTPLADAPPIDVLELVRTIAVARILMPKTEIRLSAGRQSLSDEAQALCFHAGTNSVFFGDKLLTTNNAEADRDLALLSRLGLKPLEERA